MTDAFGFSAIRNVPSSAVTRNRGGWVFYDAFGNYARRHDTLTARLLVLDY